MGPRDGPVGSPVYEHVLDRADHPGALQQHEPLPRIQEPRRIQVRVPPLCQVHRGKVPGRDTHDVLAAPECGDWVLDEPGLERVQHDHESEWWVGWWRWRRPQCCHGIHQHVLGPAASGHGHVRDPWPHPGVHAVHHRVAAGVRAYERAPPGDPPQFAGARARYLGCAERVRRHGESEQELADEQGEPVMDKAGLPVDQLVAWTQALALLKSLWVSGFFNPMSFLTAVMQVNARTYNLPLDFMVNRCTFSNMYELSEIVAQPPNGVYVHGFFMEGAGWEDGKGDEEGYITDSKLKDLHPLMPICNVFAVHIDEMSWEHMYQCPVFITSERGATFVFAANVRMDADDTDIRWILAGAALMLTDG